MKWALVAGGLMTAALAPAAALDDDEEFSLSELRGGRTTTREACEATRDAVWVSHALGTECIRYFPSANVVGAKVAAFYFHGDKLDGVKVVSYDNNHAAVLRRESEVAARANQVPYILVARPGVYGSSGRHNDRRGRKEYLSMNAAVDAIKQRYGLEQVHLGGQSGGAATVGALLTLGRTDVACAVASSGPFDALARARDAAERSGRTWDGCDVTHQCGIYNVTDHADTVAASPTRRIMLIGDPQDGNTPFVYQQAFADKLKALGHDVTLAQGRGDGPLHHGLVRMSHRALGWCHAGLPSARIVELVADDAPALGNDRDGVTRRGAKPASSP